MTNPDLWTGGDAYERYVGRWSRLVATELLAWLAPPAGLRWLDVGCGTGTLCRAAAARGPAALVGVDRSRGYAAHARDGLRDAGARFAVADAAALPFAGGAFDVVMSGLVLNFVADPAAVVAEAARVTAPGGTVAFYVWDYAEGMELMRRFWDAAADLDPRSRELDEGTRFPLCRPEPLVALFRTALADVEVRSIDVPTVFRDFDDYWEPFLGGQGPAPAYAMALAPPERERLRERLRGDLAGDGGPIRLTARAWAARGRA
jgi:SAM-dependent methyltransferase